MNKSFFALVIAVLLNLPFVSFAKETNCHQKAPVKLILDTDIGPDFDDVGAMALLHTLADSSQVSILATISCNHHELVVPSIQIINNYFGRPEILTGAPKSSGGVNLTSDHKVKWPEVIAAKYPHDINSTSKAPDAVKIYRRILSEANDSSIIICTIGFFTNLRDLLLSGSDEYSQLSGEKLVAQKVKLVVSMAGRFPNGKEYNVYKDASAGEYAINNWPTKIVFSGWEIGSRILTGKKCLLIETENSPIKDVYRLCMSERDFDGRMSWDQTAVLVAVKGYQPYYSVEQGTCMVTSDGSNNWIPGKNGKHFRLIEKISPDRMATIIESYMVHQPSDK